MADISKIIGVDIATIAKINKIDIGDIGSVNGADIPSSFVPSGTPYAWYDASQLVGLNDGDPISSWTDLGGGGHHLVQADAGLKPTYRANAQNSLPGIQADGTEGMQVIYGETLSQPNTIFVVAKVVTWNEVPANMIVDGDTVNTRNVIHIAQNTNTYKSYAGSEIDSSVSIDANAKYITALYNGVSSDLWINGVATGVGDIGAHAPGGLTVFGDYRVNFQNCKCYIMELIIYNGNEDRAYNEAYLAAKWGI